MSTCAFRGLQLEYEGLGKLRTQYLHAIVQRGYEVTNAVLQSLVRIVCVEVIEYIFTWRRFGGLGDPYIRLALPRARLLSYV